MITYLPYGDTLLMGKGWKGLPPEAKAAYVMFDCYLLIHRAAAKVREQVTGVDYTRGCSDHMLRIGGRELEEEVMRETARVSPLPDREEGELGHLDELWRSMDDSTSSMVFYTFRRGRFSFTCNDKFRRTFALERDIEDGYQQASIMPSLYFAK